MCYVQLEKSVLRNLIYKAVRKAGSEKKFAATTKIPAGCIYHYKMETRNISESRLLNVLRFLGRAKHQIRIKSILAKNWGKKKGGHACFKTKKNEGTWESNLEKMKEQSSKRMKKWHRKMKSQQPGEYYKLQYNNFKKIGRYKIRTTRGEMVRNKLEKNVADFLYEHNQAYEYEKLVLIRQKAYFPDFIIRNTIIECTEWKGVEKAYKLRDKFKDLREAGFQPILVVPERLRHYYKVLDGYIVTDIHTLLEKMPR